MSGLIVSDLGVTLGGKAVVDAVSLVAEPGQVTGLIGPNGAGKSSLMRAMLGLTPVGSGKVTFDGTDLLAMPNRLRAQRAAFVEQSGSTEARLTAHDVVMLGRIPFQSVWQSAPSAQDLQVVDMALAAVDMGPLAGRLFHTLSGGEQQRVLIGRALAQEPRLLVLDEPTSHLDVHAQLATLDLLRRRARAGATVVLALHDLNLAAAYCDALVVLSHGRVVGAGAPGDVLTPALLRTVYGVDATLLRHPGTGRPVIAYDLPNSD
jgi:iron complex transport system ATP-binding protein